MDIISHFGIQWWLLLAQIANFLIILYLLKRFAYKPILELLEKRRVTIEESHKNAQKAQASLQNALEEEKKLLKKAQEDAKARIDDANKQADELVSQAREKAKKQTDLMLKEAKEQIERDRKTMEKQLATQTTSLALSILEQSLKGFFTQDQQKAVLEKAGKALKK